MATTRQISLQEVKQHNSKKDVWIVLHNDVLDVTSFLDEHPGGADLILEWAGKDASQAFEDAGHSHDAREVAEQYKIGWLPPPERTRFIDSCCTTKSKENKNDQKSGKTLRSPPSSKWKWALLVLAAAIVVGIAYKKYAK